MISIVNIGDREQSVAAAEFPAATSAVVSPSPTPANTWMGPTMRPQIETGGVETPLITVTPPVSPVPTPTPSATAVPAPVITPAPVKEEMRGVWVAFYEYENVRITILWKFL